MAKHDGRLHLAGKRNETGTKGKLEDDVDALFRLSVTEFTAARNALAAQLKKGGRRDESDRVKALAKPSISAWAVNQLYWKHREAFDRLIATGQRFRQAQISSRAGKVADMREALDARREALSQLSVLATALLGDAGSSPTSETVHRITTTLEAMSAYASFPDDARPGRLTRDVDPPGFESFASLIPGMMKMTDEPVRVTSAPKSGRAASTPRKAEPAGKTSQLEQTRQAKIAAAKVSLQEARSLLIETRAKAQSLEAAEKKANVDAIKAEKQRRYAEERFEQARVESEAAVQRARSIAAETKGAAKAVEVAERSVEKAAKELEKLFGQ
jgi:hypothetical protein